MPRGLKYNGMDYDRDEECYRGTAAWNGSVCSVTVELLVPFTMWIKQFEAAVYAQARGTRRRSCVAAMLTCLPTRLDGISRL